MTDPLVVELWASRWRKDVLLDSDEPWTREQAMSACRAAYADGYVHALQDAAPMVDDPCHEATGLLVRLPV